MNALEDEYNQKQAINDQTLEDDWFDESPTLPLLWLVADQWSTQANFRAISKNGLPLNKHSIPDSWFIDEIPTWIIPAISAAGIPVTDATDIPIKTPQKAVVTSAAGQIALLRNLIKSSGIYALASVAPPLVALVLAPFLTHSLSPTDYGILTILTTLISLGGGITQLGMASAFIRAYNYDYTVARDQRDVLATATTLLCLFSIPITMGIAILAPFLADLVFGRPSLSGLFVLSAGVVLLQNLTVPGFAWLRAENRAFFYAGLSICNLLIMLIASLILVGVLHLGVAGSIIAIGGGYASVMIGTIPIIVLRAGIRIRADIARSMLAFGLPLVLNFVSYWVLQLSDRYLLSLFGSLEQTARYAVVYTLGSAMSIVVIGPFTLAWPTSMFAIAKRKDAAQVFRLLFRWFSMFLLLAAFGLSLVGTVLLDWLFPVAYHSGAIIIPIVAESIVFYGVYYVFMVGANVKRKTWLTAVFTTLAALVNVGLNLVLIPQYGEMGAAASTLIAYIVLALVAYIVNQRIYPISFEIDRFIVAILLSLLLYGGSSFLAQSQGVYGACAIYISAFTLYSGCLAILVKLPTRSHE